MAYLENYDSRQLRNVLGTFTTGVTVVTTIDREGMPHGVTANSFSSVSLDPPLVLWSQALTAKSLLAYQNSEYFAVNILADDQVAMSNHFAKSQPNKFAAIDFDTGIGGVPVLRGTVAHFECVKVASYTAGDHVIYLGRVERVSHSGRRPLAFAHGRYMVPYTHDLGPVSLQFGSPTVATVEEIDVATDALPAIQKAVGGISLCLSVWANHGPTVIRWLRGTNAVGAHLRTGLVMSMIGTATGRAFAAFSPTDVTRSFIEEDLRLWRVADEDELQQRERFESEIAEAKLRGLARMVNREPSQLVDLPVNAFAAPIFNRDGVMVMAVSLAADTSTLSSDWDGAVSHELRSGAKTISERLTVDSAESKANSQTTAYR